MEYPERTTPNSTMQRTVPLVLGVTPLATGNGCLTAAAAVRT